MNPYKERDLGSEYQQGIFDMLRGAKDLWLQSGMGLLNPNNPAYQYLKSPMPSGSLLDDPELVALSENLPMLDPSSVAGMTKVFHGSPHLFKNWDFSKMGSGEGAQAYGHGGYFAGSKNVGEHYAENLGKYIDPHHTYKGQKFETFDPWNKAYADVKGLDRRINHIIRNLENDKNLTAKEYIDNQITAHERGIEFIKREPENIISNPPDGFTVEGLQKIINEYKSLDPNDFKFVPQGKQSHLYEIELRPDPEDFPEYYTPISDQKNILKKYNDAYKRSKVATGEEKAKLEKALDVINPRLSIENQYHHHKTRKNKKEWFPATVVSESLSTLGIPGHKYLDATSRGNRPSKNFNYVVYPTDEADMIKITNPPQSLLD